MSYVTDASHFSICKITLFLSSK